MGTVSTNDFRKRLRIMLDGQPWIIVENEFVKPGKGQAFNRTKVKNLITGRVIERTFKSGDSVEEAEVSITQMQYLYSDGSNYTFMNTKNYEQVEISAESLGDTVQWMLENTEYEISFWNGKVISVTPPNFLELKVIEAEPAVKGDTQNNVMKKAKLETGAQVEIPLFVDVGTIVKIDTRTGEYLGRLQ